MCPFIGQKSELLTTLVLRVVTGALYSILFTYFCTIYNFRNEQMNISVMFLKPQER